MRSVGKRHVQRSAKTRTDSNERRERGVYIGFLLPAFMGLMTYVVPEPSAQIGKIVLWMLSADVLITLIGAALRMHRSNTWRVWYGILNFSLFALSTAVIFWRTWGESPLLLLFLLVLFAVGGVFGYRNRRVILQEGIKPKSKLGKRVLRLTTAFMFIGGAAGVAFGKLLGAVLGANVAIPILTTILLLIGLGIFIWTHCLWFKLENPDWKP